MISITKDEQKFLIKLARNTLSKFFKENPDADLSCSKEKYPHLWSLYGVFVSLYVSDKLRGCVGRLVPRDPLYDLVKQMSISSANMDHRFSPITYDDLKNLKIEISIISPLKKVENIEEIILGVHGVYVKGPMGNGTLLPQVAIKNRWNAEEFLGYCSRDKAGLGWDGWRSAEVYIYESLIITD
jgi:AmmeMemoRadiSam system protein A